MQYISHAQCITVARFILETDDPSGRTWARKKQFLLLPFKNMIFPKNFLAGAGVLTAVAGGEMAGVCTALISFQL